MAGENLLQYKVLSFANSLSMHSIVRFAKDAHNQQIFYQLQVLHKLCELAFPYRGSRFILLLLCLTR